MIMSSEQEHSETSSKYARENKVGKPVSENQRKAIITALDRVDMATASDMLALVANTAGVKGKSDPDKKGPLSDYQAGEFAKLCPNRSIADITAKVTEAHGEEGYKWSYKMLGKTMVKDQSQEDKDKANALVVAEIEALFA